MNTFTLTTKVAVCSLASGFIAVSALADRAWPTSPNQQPPVSIFDTKVPSWDAVDFTYEDVGGGIIGIKPHSDGLEPPLYLLLDVPDDPYAPSLFNGSPKQGIFGDRLTQADAVYATPVVPGGSVTAVPTPGSAVLLMGAIGATAMRRRRR